MLASVACIASCVALALAQATSFEPSTGVRSLWIPFKTVKGTPLASIVGSEPRNNVTVYVLSCPTQSPDCAIAPNLTLTHGDSTAKYMTTNSAGSAVVGCTLTGTTTATCNQRALGTGGNIKAKETKLKGDRINYEAVAVTALQNGTSTLPATVTVTRDSEPTTTSTGGAQTAAPWALGGVLGAGLLAVGML